MTASSSTPPVINELLARAEPEQPEAVVDRRDHERAQDRALDVADAAEQRRAADHRGGDRVEQDRAAAGVRVHRAQPRGEDEAADRRHERADREHGDLDPVDVDARSARGLGVASDRVDVAPEPGPPEHEAPEQEEEPHEQEQVRDAAVLVGHVDHRAEADRERADAQRDQAVRVVVEVRLEAYAYLVQLDRRRRSAPRPPTGSTRSSRAGSRWPDRSGSRSAARRCRGCRSTAARRRSRRSAPRASPRTTGCRSS